MKLDETPTSKKNNTKEEPIQLQTIKWLYNILWINEITQITDWWPNYLVPKGLIFNKISGKIFEYLKWKWIQFYLDTKKKTEFWFTDIQKKYTFLWLKTPRSYTKNMWLADNMDEDTKTQLVFLHEMCHHIAWELENYFILVKVFAKIVQTMVFLVLEIWVFTRQNEPIHKQPKIVPSY